MRERRLREGVKTRARERPRSEVGASLAHSGSKRRPGAGARRGGEKVLGPGHVRAGQPAKKGAVHCSSGGRREVESRREKSFAFRNRSLW